MTNTVKQHILEQYKTINKFVEAVHPRMKMSRTHLYKLINKEDVNPTMSSLIELSELTEIPLEDILNEYSLRYRDKRSGD